MKTLALIISILLSVNSGEAKVAGITRLPKKNKTQRKVVVRDKITRKSSGVEKSIDSIKEQNKRIEELLKLRTAAPVIWEQNKRILTGTIFKGVLLNSITSTNLESPALVAATPGQGLPPKTKFICSGVTAHKRIRIYCNKMRDEYNEKPIVAQLLNVNGSAGIIGEYDDGKEDMIESAIISDFFQGMFSVAQSRVQSPYGEIREDSLKNQLLQGGVRSGQTASEILLADSKNAEPIVTVDAGKPVLIYFMEAVNEN